MKNLRLLSLLWIALVSLTLVGCQKDNTPTDNQNNNQDIIIEEITNSVINYNDGLVNIAQTCFESEQNVWAAYDDENASIEDVQNAISDTITVCNDSINNLNQLGDWEGDSSLKDGVVAIIEKDIQYYSKLTELLKINPDNSEELSEEDAAAYDAIVSEINAIDDELLEANEELMGIQERFAENHWYELNNTEEAE